MPTCRKCGSYTPNYGWLCKPCYSKSKSKEGKVYFGKVVFPNGKSKIYTGQTRRAVYTRVGEHIKNQQNGNTKSYTGRGIKFKLLGSIFSKNRFKAERTCKKLSPSEKVGLAKKGAKNIRRNGWW